MPFVAYGLISLIGVMLSAMYSGMETGLYTINRVRLTVRASRGDRTAIRLRDLRQRPARMLSTLLIGNNLANYAGSFGLAAVLDRMGYSPGQVIAINAGVLIPVLFVVGETLPKDLFRTYTDQWSYATSGFLRASERIFTYTGLAPIVQGFGMLVSRVLGAASTETGTARQRISQLVKEGMSVGVLTESQTRLVDRALALRYRTVGDEMVPWSRVAVARAGMDRAQLRGLLDGRDFTRLPVVDAAGRPIGVVSLLEALLQPEAAIDTLTQPSSTFTPETSVPEALRIMRAKRHPMAFVTDPRSGRPLGLVTLKDLVEPLTGELAAW